MLEEYKDVLTTNDIAKILSTSLQTVRNLIKSKQIKAFKVGRGYRITKKDLISYITQEQ